MHIFIISWTGIHENSIHIAKSLYASSENLCIIYSDADPFFNLAAPCPAIKTPNNWFWSKKFKICLDSCQSDHMLIIHGDTSCDDWPSLVTKCTTCYAKLNKLGIWSPRIVFTPYDLSRTLIARIDNSHLCIVAQTDGIVFSLAKPILDRLRRLSYDANKFGWGIDWAALSFCYANKMIAVVDESVQVRHPKGVSYDRNAAQQQMHTFLLQLTQDEMLQYLLLNSHIQNISMKIDRPVKEIT